MAATTKQRDLIEELLVELDMDLETALEQSDHQGETLDTMTPAAASELIDFLIEEKQARKGR